MVVKELMKGVAFGVGVSLAIPIVLPVAFAMARPLTKSAIRAYLNLRDAVGGPSRSNGKPPVRRTHGAP